MNRIPVIAVIDDDESVRESLPDLLRTFGYHADAFDSAEAFLASRSATRADCLVVDVVMPGMSGPKLGEELKRQGMNIPSIFMTAHSDGAISEQLLKEGASAFFLKPFDPKLLIDAISSVLSQKDRSPP